MPAFFYSLHHLTLVVFSLSNRKFLRVFYACFPIVFYIYFHLLFNLFSSAFLLIFSSTFLPIFLLFFYLSFPLHFYLFFPCLATYLSLTFQPFFPGNSLPFLPSLPLPHLTFLPLCLPHPSTPLPTLAFLPPYLPAHLSLNPEVSLAPGSPQEPLGSTSAETPVAEDRFQQRGNRSLGDKVGGGPCHLVPFGKLEPLHTKGVGEGGSDSRGVSLLRSCRGCSL